MDAGINSLIYESNQQSSIGESKQSIKYVIDPVLGKIPMNLLNKAEDYENMDLEKLIPKYETVKEAKTEKYKELEKLSKSQQVKMLIELNITRGEMKKLKTEDDRVKFIIKKSKLKSLK